MQARSSAGSEPSRITLVRERLIVLRGAIFSLCVLALICTFGTIARVSTYLGERIFEEALANRHDAQGHRVRTAGSVDRLRMVLGV